MYICALIIFMLCKKPLIIFDYYKKVNCSVGLGARDLLGPVISRNFKQYCNTACMHAH